MSRFDYVKYDTEAVNAQLALKEQFEKLEHLVVSLTMPGRAQSLIFTALEEAYMWCGKQIRDDQLKRAPAEPNEERAPP